MRLPVTYSSKAKKAMFAIVATELAIAVLMIIWQVNIRSKGALGQELLPNATTQIFNRSNVEPTPSQKNFGLPITAMAPELTAVLQQASVDFQVVLASVDIQSPQVTRQLVNHNQITFAVQGGYPKIMQFLSRVVDSGLSLTVNKLSAKRLGRTDQLEMQAIVDMWYAPVAIIGNN